MRTGRQLWKVRPRTRPKKRFAWEATLAWARVQLSPARRPLGFDWNEPVLGSFVLDLAPDEWATLASKAKAVSGIAGAGDKAPATRLRASREGQPTRVRILVVVQSAR